MQPAQQAIDDINNAVVAAKDAARYDPDDLASVQSKLADLNTYFAQKNYTAVLESAPAVLASAKELPEAAEVKRAKLRAVMLSEWSALAASVPKLLEAVKTRLTALSGKHRPANDVDLASAKSRADTATEQWWKAQAAFNAGDIEDAMSAARRAKGDIELAVAALRLELPRDTV
jgi:tetratricopeptide (TPR) repeat protein